MPRIPRPTAVEPEFTEEADEFDTADDEAQTSRPARTARTRPADDEDDAPRSRRGRDEEDEPTGSPIASGWGAFKEKRAASGEFAEQLKVEKKAILIAFVDNAPFAVYREHWIERPGKKSFICLEKGCPLCEAGDNRPRVKTCFNVIEMIEGGLPELKMWVTTPRLTGQLASLDSDEKVGPLTKGYWSVKRTGEGTKTTYNISPVKERDLKEDWGVEPLSDDDFARYETESYTTDAITFSTKQQLREVADEIAED